MANFSERIGALSRLGRRRSMERIRNLSKDIKYQVKLKTQSLPHHLRTVDVRFEEAQQNFLRLFKLLNEVYLELSKQKDVRTFFSEPLIALTNEMASFYNGANRADAETNEEFITLNEICITLIEDFGQHQREFLSSIERHLNHCENLKRRIVDRNMSLLEYDLAKNNLRTTHDKSKTMDKVHAADAKLKVLQQTYNSRNSELTEELTQFYEERHSNFKTEFQQITVRQVMAFNSISNAHLRVQSKLQPGKAPVQMKAPMSHHNDLMVQFAALSSGGAQLTTSPSGSSTEGSPNSSRRRLLSREVELANSTELPVVESTDAGPPPVPARLKEEMPPKPTVEPMERKASFKSHPDIIIGTMRAARTPKSPDIVSDVSLETTESSWNSLWNNLKPLSAFAPGQTVWTEKNIHDCWSKFSRHSRDAYTKKLLRRESIPIDLRPQIWPLIADIERFRGENELPDYPTMKEIFNVAVSEATEQIEKDITRTFPQEKRVAFNDELRAILRTYAHTNPSIGYCQSMNFIAAALLFFLPEEQAFWLMKIMIDDMLPRHYYSQSMIGLLVDQRVFKYLLCIKLPQLCTHFSSSKLDIEPIIVSWFLSLYTVVFEIQESSRVIEQFLFEGDVTLFRIALAIFKLNEKNLLRLNDFTDLFVYLSRMAQTTAAYDFDLLLKKSYTFEINKTKLAALRARYYEEVSKEKSDEEVRRLERQKSRAALNAQNSHNSPSDTQKWIEKRRTIAHRIAFGDGVSREDFIMQRTSEHMDQHLIQKAVQKASQNKEGDHIEGEHREGSDEEEGISMSEFK
ncbi:hypothetical protein PROFUN_01760 [Planoprotostelium fungivorum]|uniref:Rab-GAP TBC domain-containing protein n=1 Tax=Planoprotostelium fungivorum TaxID=1890364 RepID=A0A2P6MWF1_9EUKA|nr:hypothetical protein PROFUN_01760 [Planoprotostelium fungivorum]